jgi:hypothetical protein
MSYWESSEDFTLVNEKTNVFSRDTVQFDRYFASNRWFLCTKHADCNLNKLLPNAQPQISHYYYIPISHSLYASRARNSWSKMWFRRSRDSMPHRACSERGGAGPCNNAARAIDPLPGSLPAAEPQLPPLPPPQSHKLIIRKPSRIIKMLLFTSRTIRLVSLYAFHQNAPISGSQSTICNVRFRCANLLQIQTRLPTLHRTFRSAENINSCFLENFNFLIL